MKAATAYLSKQSPLMLAAGAALLLGVVYLIARKAIGAAAGAAGGLVSGNNAITEGTAYEGAGVLGTLGASINSALPFLDDVGTWVADRFPAGSAGESVYYMVSFPDGTRHAIAAGDVSKDGVFTYKGARYVLGTQGGKRVARAA